MYLVFSCFEICRKEDFKVTLLSTHLIDSVLVSSHSLLKTYVSHRNHDDKKRGFCAELKQSLSK